MNVNAQEFKAWRERLKLTQETVAQRFRVSRTTIQNWESGATPISQAVEMSCEIWEPRLKQEDPDLGPVTLIYTDGPMFVDPYGPRQRLAMMRQEACPTNAWAIARVLKCWGRDGFCNPFIIEKSGKPLWNVIELQRVVEGSDTGAPTVSNLLKAIAEGVKSTSASFVWTGKGPNPSGREERRQRIEGLATELDALAATTLDNSDSRQQVEEVFFKLRSLGKMPQDSLVNSIAQAFAAAEQD